MPPKQMFNRQSAPDEPLKPSPGQDYREVMARGRSIDYRYLLVKCLLDIADLSKRDLINDNIAFNAWKFAVDNLHANLTAYSDEYFEVAYDLLFEEEYLTVTERIEFVWTKQSMLLKLMKRKAFLPPDDMEAKPIELIEEFKRRVASGLDCLIPIEGERGSGKSNVALYLGFALDLSFNLGRVVFNGDDLRRLIDRDNPPPGTVYVWDEAGAGKGMAKRRFMSVDNVEFLQMIQVIRSRGLIVFFTVPDAQALLDTQQLAMVGGKIVTRGNNRSDGEVMVSYQERQGSGDKMRWVYLRSKNGMERLTLFIIPYIAKRVFDSYEELKKVFVNTIIKVKGAAGQTEDPQVRELATYIVDHPEEAIGPMGKMTIRLVDELCRRNDIPTTRSTAIKALAEKLMMEKKNHDKPIDQVPTEPPGEVGPTP